MLNLTSLFIASPSPTTPPPPGVGMKSNFGLARIDYDNFATHFCVYRVSFSRQITEMQDYLVSFEMLWQYYVI